MKHGMKLLILAGALALSLGGCTALQQAAGDSPVATDAIKGAQLTITTYVDVYQPAVLAYGNLPLCPTAAICRDASVHAKLKAVDLAASKAIAAAHDVLTTNVADTGQITAALQAVMNAESAIAQAGVTLKQ